MKGTAVIKRCFVFTMSWGQEDCRLAPKGNYERVNSTHVMNIVIHGATRLRNSYAEVTHVSQNLQIKIFTLKILVL